ncbi:hypothetical protein IWQ62_002334 [Dispira parvispora]|uniref:SH3 domain-containing protein n=1 Tax=Dispira parvispora TaxID=1520584 RepID=A0A9W8AQJ5_9FUNG|nr:hypothetical protein IWQ62_002334 [Dispira parvispora]
MGSPEEDTIILVRCRHDYKKQRKDEVSMRSRDYIVVLSQDVESWWVGWNLNSGEQGWFPKDHVGVYPKSSLPKIQREIQTKTQMKSSKKKSQYAHLVEVLFDYEQQDVDELTLTTGEIVGVFKEIEGWYQGEKNGVQGIFPANFVRVLSKDDIIARGLQNFPHTHSSPSVLPQRVSEDSPRLQATPVLSKRESDVATMPSLPPANTPLPPPPETSPTNKSGQVSGDASKVPPAASLPAPPPVPTADDRNVTNPPPPVSDSTSAQQAIPPVPRTNSQWSNHDDKEAAEEPAEQPSTVESGPDTTVPKALPSAALPPTPGMPLPTSAQPRTESGKKSARVIRDYEAQDPGELNLFEGHIITVLAQRGDYWKGESHGKIGYFPPDTVELLEPTPEEEPTDTAGGDNASTSNTEGDSADQPKNEAAPTLATDEAQAKAKKLAAYGVRQGGIGSLFAGGVVPKLKKVQRSTPSEEPSVTSAHKEAPVHSPIPQALPELPQVPPPVPPVVKKVAPTPEEPPKEEVVKEEVKKPEEEAPAAVIQESPVPHEEAEVTRVPSPVAEEQKEPAPVVTPPMVAEPRQDEIKPKELAVEEVSPEPESEQVVSPVTVDNKSLDKEIASPVETLPPVQPAPPSPPSPPVASMPSPTKETVPQSPEIPIPSKSELDNEAPEIEEKSPTGKETPQAVEKPVPVERSPSPAVVTEASAEEAAGARASPTPETPVKEVEKSVSEEPVLKADKQTTPEQAVPAGEASAGEPEKDGITEEDAAVVPETSEEPAVEESDVPTAAESEPEVKEEEKEVEEDKLTPTQSPSLGNINKGRVAQRGRRKPNLGLMKKKSQSSLTAQLEKSIEEDKQEPSPEVPTTAPEPDTSSKEEPTDTAKATPTPRTNRVATPFTTVVSSSPKPVVRTPPPVGAKPNVPRASSRIAELQRRFAQQAAGKSNGGGSESPSSGRSVDSPSPPPFIPRPSKPTGSNSSQTTPRRVSARFNSSPSETGGSPPQPPLRHHSPVSSAGVSTSQVDELKKWVEAQLSDVVGQLKQNGSKDSAKSDSDGENHAGGDVQEWVKSQLAESAQERQADRKQLADLTREVETLRKGTSGNQLTDGKSSQLDELKTYFDSQLTEVRDEIQGLLEQEKKSRQALKREIETLQQQVTMLCNIIQEKHDGAET